MTYDKAIEMATELAYEEDADQVVGKICGEWVVAHIEDDGTLAQMDAGGQVNVDADGIIGY